MSKINITKNSINYADIQSNDESGLLINGGTWRINRDGSASFANIDGAYIPNSGNTTSGGLSLTRDTYTFNLPSSAPLLVTGPLNGHSFITPVIAVSNAGVNINYSSQGSVTALALTNGKAYYLNPSNPSFDDNREIAVINDVNQLQATITTTLGNYIPNAGNEIDDVDLELVRKSFSLKSDEITLKNKTLTLATKTGDNITDKSILNDGSLQIYKFDSLNTLLTHTYISTDGFGVNTTIDDIQYRSHHEYNKLYIARDDLDNIGSIEFKVDDDQVMYIQNNKNNVVRYTYLNLDTAELYLTKGSDYFRLNTNQIYISSNTLHKYFASFLNEQDNLTKIALSGPNNYLEISPVYLKMGHASGSNAYFDVNLYDSSENLLSLEKGYEYVDGSVNYSSDMQLNIKRDKFEFIYDADRTYNNETVKYKGELLLNSGLYFKSTTNAGSTTGLFYDAGTFSVGLAHSNFSITQSRLDYSTSKTSLAIIEGLYDFRTSDNDYELHTHAQYDIFYLYSNRKSDNKMQYQLQLMEGNSWIKSETGNWEFALSQYDGGLTWGGPASAIQAGKYQFALYGKGANSGSSYNIDNDGYDLVLNPGGATISTNSGSSKTYLNLTMGSIESKSTWDNYVDGIAAHKVYASSGEFYTLSKNPGNYAYQYVNGGGFSGIKINNSSNHQQLTMYDGSSITTPNYDLIKNYSTGLNYQWYFNKSSGDTSDKNYVKLNATNSNFNYSYNSTTDTYTTTTGLSFYPNSFNINYNSVNSAGQDALTSNFGFQIHTTMFGLTAAEDTYTSSGSGDSYTTTKTGTYTTTATSSAYTGLDYKISTEITDSSKFSGSRMNIGLKINSTDIDIYAGDGTNYAPKSRLYMGPTTAKITGEYNSDIYTLEWKWMQGPTLGLYASSTDGYTPVLKGFKIYDENDNLLSDSYLPLTGGTVTGNTYIETDYSAYDTLKGKTSLNSGAIYLELLDSPTYGTWNSQLGMSASSGITWSRNQITGSHNTKYQTNVQLIDSGYYLYTKDTSSDKADSIYLQAGQLELVNNRVTDTSHAKGQVNLSTTSLYITNGNNQVNLSCDPSNIQLYLSGTNQTIRLSKDGLTFNGDNIPVESLYFSKDGIGYTTKESYNRKTTYYLTSSATNISYKNQSQTGTLTFKPATIDGEVQFKIANTIEDTTHEVTIYNGHTSTTQTEFNSTDYVTKQYVSSIVPDVNSCIPNEGNVLTSTNTDITRSTLTLKSMNTLISTAVAGAPDSYINLTPTHIILDNNRGNDLSSSIELSNSTINILSKANSSVITLETGNSNANKTSLELRGTGDGEPGLHYYYSKNSKTFKLDVSEKMFNGETDGGRIRVWNEKIGTQAELTLDDKFTVQYYNNEITMLANGTSTFGNDEGVELYLANGTGYLNKANVTKLYNDPTTELVIKGDLDNYVSKTEYNELKDGYDDLLEKYNDLTERLNEFLIDTGEVPDKTTWPPEYDEEGTTRKTIINTVDTNEVNIQCTFYGSNDITDINDTIDWGDGTVENIKDLITERSSDDVYTITHTYDSSKEYVITVEDISQTVVFSLGDGNDSLVNNDIKDLAVYHGRAPLIKNNTSIEKYATLIPYCPDNEEEYNEKWEQLTQIDFIDSKTSISDPTTNNTSICCGLLWHSGWFKDCSKLKIVNIGSTAKYINYMFDNCPNIEEIHIKATTPPELIDTTNGLFVNGIPTNCTIYVPTESVDIYKNDTGSSQYETFGWSNYADHIVGE